MKLTPTEQRIYNLLSDGMPHTSAELCAVIDPELANGVSIQAVSGHIGRMRKKLEPGRSLDITCSQRNHVFWYRLVALIVKGDDN